MALFSGSAHAWVETEVHSHVATVDVDRAGKALVTEDLTLGVRGGPLPGLELAGVDLDAEILPDGVVSAVSGSKAQLSPTPLLLDKRDDGTLRIEIDRDKGLRTGVYLFHFAYRTNLLARDLIRREGNDAEVRWIGPRFNQGIDSARVLFRLPAGPVPPTLPSADSSAGRIDDSDALGGVFIGNLHRLPDKDELDVVRPHVSKGEPVVWRVRTSAKVFDAFLAAAPAPLPLSVPATRAAGFGGAQQSRQRLLWWLGAALIALGYAFAVAGKWRIFSALCRARGATARALVGLPVGPRAALSGTALAAAFIAAAWFDQATLGAALLVLAMALAVQYVVPAKVVLRGPGQWLPLSDSEAFARASEHLPGRYLDAGTWLGFLVFGACCATFCGAALALFARAPYQALLLMLGSPCLLPVFFTGRAEQLPADAAKRPRATLAAIAKALRAHAGVKVVPWARIPERAKDADELRLLVQVQGALRGLVGIEIGIEYSAGFGGPSAVPFALVRAREGSLAVEALPREVVWTRGRRADERAAVLHARLPTRAECVALVLELAELLREENQVHRKRTNLPERDTRATRVRVASPAHVI
ncbi:MAG TPA: hypothetical protein VHV51_12070 [Polyangiaceae bacterium]|nr:hypothetical protein [Polyangiaceae bacterium]